MTHSTRTFRLQLRTVVLLIMMMTLLLPIGGIMFFRLYENEIVRQTERELVAQAAFISSFLLNATDHSQLEKRSVSPKWPGLKDPNGRFQPLEFHTDITKEYIRGPRPEPQQRDIPPKPEALLFGDYVSDFLETAKKTTLAGMKVLDANGIQLNRGAGHGQSFAHIHEVAQAQNGIPEIVLRAREYDSPFPRLSSLSRGSGIRMFLAYPVIKDQKLFGIVYLSRTPKRPFKQLYIDRYQLLVFLLSIVGCAVLIGLFISFMLTQPLKKLAHKAADYAQNPQQHQAHIARPMTHEIANVDDALDSMAQKLAARMAALDRFAGYVSHELKNPIAAIKGSLELITDDDDMSVEQRHKFVNNAFESASHLEQILSRLVELTRLENEHHSHAKISLSRLRELTGEIVKESAPLQLTWPDELDIEDIHISEPAWHHIIHNLFSNSVKHQAQHVVFSIKQQSSTIVLTYHDDGTGISHGNLDKVFQPFFTLHKSSGGTGLGLTFVKTLLEQREATIEPVFSDSGAQFVITIPFGRNE